MKTNTILKGDSLTKLKELPNESINCVMTSPPYWALRDYGVEGQLGLEPTFEEYITKLCDIFDEVKRVLRKDGTCWVNLGDTYLAQQGKGFPSTGQVNIPDKDKNAVLNIKRPKEIPPKCLTMIPQRFVIEMVNRGWILRNTIIWHKPNCMPSSVKDRFTVDFEYIFFFVKNKKYWFETQYEPIKESSEVRSKYTFRAARKDRGDPSGTHTGKDKDFVKVQGRNKRTTWKICPQPFPEAHFAVYPEELCQTPIKAGCPEEGIVLDPFFGSGTTGLVALKQNKKFIGIELNTEYIEMAKRRLKPLLEQEKLK